VYVAATKGEGGFPLPAAGPGANSRTFHWADYGYAQAPRDFDKLWLMTMSWWWIGGALLVVVVIAVLLRPHWFN